MAEKFVLGVNYWPRRKGVYWWRNFDAGEVDEEFGLIRYLGLDVVRLFLLWDDFQPTPDTVAPVMLERLRTVCDIARRHALGLDITFFTGHMSGPNWPTGWQLDPRGSVPFTGDRPFVHNGRRMSGGYRNMVTDPVSLDAERLQLRTVVDMLKTHPAVWMWNLGNEPDLFAEPPDALTGQAWVREMAGIVRHIDPGHPVTCGLHAANLIRNNGYRVDQVFAETDVAVSHGYPMYMGDTVRNPLDPDVVPFMCALTTALCGKPTLMEEFGGCTAAPGRESYIMEWDQYGTARQQFMASEDDLAAYIEVVLPKLVEVGATGAMLWCFADFAPELWDHPPYDAFHHERFFGLVRPDGTLKPHARVLKAFAETHPVVLAEPLRRLELDITPDEYYRDPLGHLRRLYQNYLGG